MTNHFQLSDNDFLYQFKNASLQPQLFSHEAHLRLAWLHIKNYGIDVALETVKQELINFVNHLGAKDKYNETVTLAAVKAVYHFMLKSNTSSFKDFIAQFPRLKTNFKDLLAQHYGVDVFNSELAKSTFLIPDKLPFD